MKKKFKQ